MSTGHIGLVAHGGGDRTGNQRYMVELGRALIARNDGLRYTVFYTRESTREQIAFARKTSTDRAQFWKIRPESPWLRLSLSLPMAIRRSGVDLIHTQYAIPAFTRTPTVVIVPDIFFARRPDLYPTVQRWQLSYRVPRAVRSARRLIVPSEFTRRDILDYYGTGANRMRVIPHGTSDRFRPHAETELVPVRQKYELPERFLLFIGARVPRKNLVGLVRAFTGLPEHIRRSCPLVLGGPGGWMRRDLDEALAPLLAEGTARCLGFVPEDDLPALISLATIFTFPSLCEGFGLPAVEAMRAGTCLLAARSGSLPEVVGEAGLLVDPLDVNDIRRGLALLMQNPRLRAELEERGRARCARYSWERAASETVAVFEEVLAEGKRSPAFTEGVYPVTQGGRP